jgi:transposase InsO family protein
VELIDEAHANGARLFMACKELGISIRTRQRWLRDASARTVNEDGRKNAVREKPAGALSEEERRRILEVANSLEYASRPPAQIVADLADKGEWLASESTIYRVLREKGHQHHRGRAKNPVRRPPASHSATAPNQVWTWDITFLKTPVRGIYYYLYMIVDIYSRCIVGWEVYEEETGECARELITRAYIRQALWRKDRPLVLHSDNGSPMKASTFRATLERLGITDSYSRPRTSDDNAYSEALFRTLKYRPEYPAFGFENLEAARGWTHQFVQWYNEIHRHSALRYVTPGQRHRGESAAILAARKVVFEEAKRKHPERWKGRSARNLDEAEVVWLNPEKDGRALETLTQEKRQVG